MKKQLYYKLLSVLIDEENYISVSVLSEQFHVSTKTIRNYLSNNDFLSLIYPCKIEKKPNLGVKLIGNKNDILKIKRFLLIKNKDLDAIEIRGNKEQNYILNFLFQSENYCTSQSLANKLYKSKSSIQGDIEVIREFLKEFHVAVNTKENLGIWLDGEERNIRNAYQNFIFNYIEDVRNQKDKGILKVNFEFIEVIQGILPKLNVSNIAKTISYSEEVLGNKFTDNDKALLLIRLSILTQRLLIGKTVTNNHIKLKNIKEYFAAEIIRINIEKEYPVLLNEDEVLEISEYLLSCRSQKQYISQDEYFNSNIAKQFLSKVGDFLEMDLKKDESLLNNLMIHLKPAIRRLRYGVKSENPILKDIRYEYSDVYLAVLTCIEEIEKSENVAFDINEIGYICLHIVAAINRKEKGRYIKACLICDSGLTITKYLESAISVNIKEIMLENSITSDKINESIYHEYDLVLDTTSKADNHYLNSIEIKTIFDKSDIALVNHWILERQINYSKNSSVFRDTVFLFKENNITPKDLFIKYGMYLEQNGYVESGFIQSIFEREKKASTLIGKGVAVPHGYHEFVKKSAMIIIKLNEEIQWGDEKVDIVFLLAMNFNHEEENKKIFRKLYQIIADDEKLHLLKTAQDLETLKSMFFNNKKDGNKMELNKIINKENINLSLEASDKKDAFKKIANMFLKNNVIENVDDYVNAVIKREEEFSTGIGYGIAIPHAKCKAVKKPAVAVAKLCKEIEYRSFDDEPITTLFMIAVPEKGADDHIKILGALTRRFMHEEFRNELKNAKTAEDIIALLN